MPSGGYVVWVVQDDHALDSLCGEKGNRYDAGLPTKDAKPADDVTEKFLLSFWGELGCPMVLAT